MLKKNESYGNLTIGSSHLGNIQDVSPRMKDEILSNDLIVVDSIEEYNKMCEHFGISSNAEIFLHSNSLGNHEDAWNKAQEYLIGGKNVLIIASRGLPNIADIGPTITRRSEFGLKVMPRIIPGPSMMSTAAAIVGFDTTMFTFLQSLPREKEMRTEFLNQLKDEDRTFMFFNKFPANTKDLIQEIFDCFKDFKKVLVAILVNVTEDNENVIIGTHYEVIKYLENPEITFSHTDKVTIVVQNYENFDKKLQIHREHF
jgi:16S rRNA (cytidine1402-2'-O)-methyltransferase